MLNHLILGTAGHIDHGKTSLVAALTGTNTDRLPEEKKRGITIEPGYAFLDLPPFRLGIVDVPGHEKFIRQMLAGATGIDMALLVIAANDSVKQQTREHLDILRILDLPAGVIALTKSDLIEADWLALVEEEIRGLVRDTFLAEAPIVPTSSKSGAGLDSLKAALHAAAIVAAESDRRLRVNGAFRMPIDRAFTIEGHGTVVTGSVNSGSTTAGDTLEIQPGGHRVRVRSVESHDSAPDSVRRGQRAALNLAGVDLEIVHRGKELCAPGHLVPSQLMTVKLMLLESATHPLKDGKRVRFHVGTSESLANVRLLDRDSLSPGDSCFAQIFLSEPAVAVWHQPFVIRRESPMYTIGGGKVLDPTAARIRNVGELELRMLSRISSDNPLERADASAFFHSESDWQPEDLPRTAGIHAVVDLVEQLKASGRIIELKLSATRTMRIQRDRFDQFCGQVLGVLEKMHEEYPMRFKHSRADLEARFAWLPSREILTAAIRHLYSEKKIELDDLSIGLLDAGPRLSKGERQLLEQLVEQVRRGGLKPPAPAELTKLAARHKDSVNELLRLAGENGELVAIASDLYFHREIFDDACMRLRSEIEKSGALTMSEIRQVLDTSRKYAIPLCEYLDSIDFTRRDGEKRMLGSRP